jgi:hypothetical protein
MRFVIGYARSRSEGLIYEQLLRDRGVPAFSELGYAFGEFSESAQCRIYAEEDLFRPEHADIVREVMGPNAADITLARFGEDKHREEKLNYPVAWFADEDAAEPFVQKLVEKGLQAWASRVDDAGDTPVGLFIVAEQLTEEIKSKLRSILGDALDDAAISG